MKREKSSLPLTFTSVLGNEVVQMAFERAASDPIWNERTLLTPEEFSDLLKMVVKTTYFRFQGKIYEHTFSMSMGSPLSPGLLNLFMEYFEDKALKEAIEKENVRVNGPRRKESRGEKTS